MELDDPPPRSSTAPTAGPRPASQWARGFDQWRAASQAFQDNMARFFVAPPEQSRALQQLVASLAPPREELQRVLDQVQAQRAQLEALGRQLDSIEASVVRFASLAEAIEERAATFSSLFQPGVPASRRRPPA